MKWTIEDPYKFVHIVELDDAGIWHGDNNLAHVYNLEERHLILDVLRRQLLKQPEAGVWGTYTWLRIYS